MIELIVDFPSFNGAVHYDHWIIQDDMFPVTSEI